MAVAPTPVSPYRSVDVHGRALPLTEEEIVQRNASRSGHSMRLPKWAIKRTTQTLEALMVAIDEEPLSSRRRFR